VTLAFRNIDIDPGSAVSSWPAEAVQTAIERGGLSDWRRLVAEVRRQPWGRTARQIEEVLTHTRPYGTAHLLEQAIERARADAHDRERTAVAAEVRQLIEASGLTQAAFAARIGTSASRLSTYATGRVVPSATLMLRMRAAASRR
jgi:DNA-binding transcriptional regulator YiaG